ncbi:Krr1-domain-containing protein [Pleomassaria siparia CBS 279.74]|uniref:Krr1-domain-containing protein n=1 Tax=Pleomassaria siparia CBS 279.74 TaxID=1314801 RepID=A0A6G1KDZ2_9PLEO|nr:Krr1-domain-containing protein [Pleomassaria siparia CBS 279.74]
MARPKSARAKATRALTDPNNANNAPLGERPAKKVKLLDHSDDEPDSDQEDGGISLKVNEEYARRFEYNNKRAEKHRLEEKYANAKGGEESEEDSEDGVEEDDDGELATENLDAEISATLQALRSKDPRVYDSTVTFYQPIDEEGEDGTTTTKKAKALTLRDYHTKNLQAGITSVDEEEDAPTLTEAQEQEQARQSLLNQVKNTGDDEEDEDFMVAKPRQKQKERIKKITADDIKEADKDPETFLSNFMASRAWVPTDRTAFQPLESDDEEEDDRADEFESAYNMYFESTAGANEKITTYARDAVAATTVRRDGQSSRKRARDLARAKREAERQEKEADLARLRKLKIEEIEDKVKTIRKIGGFSGRDFKIEDWSKVLEEDFSSEQWDEEMRKRFGDAYYDEVEDAEISASDEGANNNKSKKKPKKPKFDDDIDIKDLIPDFEDDEVEQPAFTLSSDEEEQAVEDASEEPAEKRTSKQRKQERADAKSSARRDRRLIEKLVDSNLEYETALAAKAKAPSRFRYRETSPTTFGLTPRDILLASDTQLNEFAGLKKLASFREPEKKKKDKKHLSKKARIRQWRTETFGDPEGPKGGFEVLLGGEAGVASADDPNNKGDELVDIREGKKKKKRSRKRKAGEAEI